MKKRNKAKKRYYFYLALIIIITVAALSGICIISRIKMNSSNVIPKYSKVVLLGIDAMDPKVTKALIEDGDLPNFKKLSESGSFLTLNTTYPPETPVAWSTIATGVNPGGHNIFDYIRRDKNTYLPLLSLAEESAGISGTKYESFMKGTPFWDITSKNNIPTYIIRWPLTFPPTNIYGEMLSGLGVPDIKGFLSGYTLYSSVDIDKEIKPSQTIIKVTVNDKNIIKTNISGPRVAMFNGARQLTADMSFYPKNDSIEIIIDNKNYTAIKNKWSSWIRVNFKPSPFQKISGIFRAYLISIDPFQMYVSSIQIDPSNPVYPISYPESLSKSLADVIGLYDTLGIPEETDGVNDGYLDKKALLEQINLIDKEREDIFWNEFLKFSKNSKGVIAIDFDSSDRLQHIFWNNKVLGAGKKEKKVNDSIAEYYRKKDLFLGKLINEIDSSTLLIIFSDHGFTSFERAVNINTWLAENGYLALTRNINEIGNDALFKYVDWDKTKAYSVGFSSIYLNLKGRESRGIVSVDEIDILMDEIIKKLENLTDKRYNVKVINKAYLSKEIYSGKYTSDAPDIIIGFNPGYRMAGQSAIGGFAPEVISDNNAAWKGDHLVDPNFVPGILFANFRINGSTADTKDIFPTVLDALGISQGRTSEGRSLINEKP